MNKILFPILIFPFIFTSCVSITIDVEKITDKSSVFHDSYRSTGDVTKIVAYDEEKGIFVPVETGTNNDKLLDSISSSLKIAAEIAKALK